MHIVEVNRDAYIYCVHIQQVGVSHLQMLF